MPLPYLSRLRCVAALGGAATLVACASLPSSGPTARQIERAAAPGAPFDFRVVPLDAGAIAALARPDSREGADSGMAALAEAPVADVVGPGDVLSVTLYEIGVSLFAGQARTSTGSFDPSARSEQFPQVPIDDRGEISLPYIGRIAVAGLTTTQVAQSINQALIAKSQTPQALVTVATNVTNTVYLSGDVRKPARIELTRGRERLLDAIALAGGAAFPSEDMVVRVARRGRVVEQRLATLAPGAADDVVLIPGDRVDLIRRARSFTVFGATDRVSQVPFDAQSVSLAEAVARVGGPRDSQADPSAVFLFRYDAGAQPVVYRLDLLNPASYFLAQRFAMRDKDVIYIANAAANQPTKLVGIINQLFSPFVTARAVTR